MATRFSRGVDASLGRLEGTAARSCVYARGEDTVTLSLLPAATGRDDLLTGPRSVGSLHRDWLLVRPGDLVLDGETTVPQPGDTITDQDEVYEVLRRDGDDDCYQLSGPDHQVLRIHTRRIATEAE